MGTTMTTSDAALLARATDDEAAFALLSARLEPSLVNLKTRSRRGVLQLADRTLL